MVISDLTDGGGGGANGVHDAPRSPDMNMSGGDDWQRQGFSTPYNGRSEWDAPQGATTPYGATPYGNSGGGWN